ncbi:csbd family protein [Flavobacterium limnosediminis JC2902]|uniref:Csbd family protein n=1 Tax=Flavobacterium limnosediminis JC2902 TaxID=1341181 RepID=V6SIF0_9FLAO|nr:csbd family protein [Flavobacterium limnosediminis]ESU26361.1 csbd family protein [Flavobacterium limnosediminis JC2902]
MEKGKTVTAPVKLNWEDQKKKLRAKFSTLTDADLNFEEGKKNEMFLKIQTKLGKTRSELDDVISKY